MFHVKHQKKGYNGDMTSIDSEGLFTLRDPQAAKDALVAGRKGHPGVKGLYYQHYAAKLKLAALSSFRWAGLGDISSRIVEKTLYEQGLGVFYTQRSGELADWGYGETLDAPRHVFRRAIRSGGMDGNFEMSEYRTIQPSGSGRLVKCHGPLAEWGGVPVFDIDTQDSYIRQTVAIQAYRLADLTATIDINSRNTRTPRLIVGDESLKQTLGEINAAIDEGIGAVSWNSKLGSLEDRIKVLDLGVDAHGVEALSALFARFEGEAYAAIGVQAQDSQKQAQQSIAEITATESLSASVRIARFDARRWAADALNRRYGLSVSVVDTGTGETNG